MASVSWVGLSGSRDAPWLMKAANPPAQREKKKPTARKNTFVFITYLFYGIADRVRKTVNRATSAEITQAIAGSKIMLMICPGLKAKLGSRVSGVWEEKE